MKSYFITATDTDAGKTFISSGLLKYWSNEGYETLGFKPVASGCQPTPEGLRNDDALALMAAASVSLGYDIINPYSFEPAIAPHLAAAQAGMTIDLETIVSDIFQYQKKAERVLVEGVGGWLVPLNERQSVADLACMLDFPIILVVNIRLGCINHALLTVQAIEQRGLTIAGWVANSAGNVNSEEEDNSAYFEENIQSIQSRFTAPLLGVVPYLSANDTEAVSSSSMHSKNQLTDFLNMEKCI